MAQNAFLKDFKLPEDEKKFAKEFFLFGKLIYQTSTKNTNMAPPPPPHPVLLTVYPVAICICMSGDKVLTSESPTFVQY